MLTWQPQQLNTQQLEMQRVITELKVVGTVAKDATLLCGLASLEPPERRLSELLAAVFE